MSDRPPDPPLSPATRERAEALFQGRDLRVASRMLLEECGGGLPMSSSFGESAYERIRFAVLKVSGGTLSGMERAVSLANTDWRDLLIEAGFAKDVTAHERWFPER